MVLTYEDTSGSTPNYKNLVQTVLTKGLGVLAQQSSSGNTGWTQGFWSQNADAANLGYLMWSGSVSVGCAVTDGCEDNKFLILCLFNPTAAGDVAPFDENVYKALVARTTLLTQMTESDLQAAGSGAVMGLPSLLLAGFVAALAMVTV
uniref:Surface antigen 4 n=1 Tax=Eimeria stiedai TaxID=471275 RepID=A0A6H0C284_9EIME|nr:surface antigen 4 [Eimeria stiedai]